MVDAVDAGEGCREAVVEAVDEAVVEAAAKPW